MKSKSHIGFLARIAHFDSDIELADILVSTVANNSVLDSQPFLFFGINPHKHPRLAARQVTTQNQKIAIGHLKNTLYCSFIKDLYEEFTIYLYDTLRLCARKGLNPKRLIGEHHFDITANELLSLGSWDAVVDYVSSTIFRKLENERSTSRLISSFDKKLALKLNKKTVDAAMPFLDLRHILVHCDGKADSVFCEKYPTWELKENDPIIVSYTRVEEARNSVKGLVEHIDSQVIDNELLDSSEVQGQGI